MESCFPPEIWSQIFWNACTDKGTTGCSISRACRYFNNISKPVKLRSVAIEGFPQAISFLTTIEALPANQRNVENLYLSLYDPKRPLVDQDDADSPVYQSISLQLSEMYKLKLDPRENVTSAQRCIENPDELRIHVVFRILDALAPSLEYLSLSFAYLERQWPFLPIELPRLSELAIAGTYYPSKDEGYQDKLPILPALRRLKICQNSFHTETIQILKAIPAYAPNLTHLRIDEDRPYDIMLHSTIDALLPSISGETPETTSLHCLERVLIHPGVKLGQFMCGTAMMQEMMGMGALQKWASSDQRLFLFEAESSRSPFSHVENMREWIERVNGGLACWNEGIPT